MRLKLKRDEKRHILWKHDGSRYDEQRSRKRKKEKKNRKEKKKRFLSDFLLLKLIGIFSLIPWNSMIFVPSIKCTHLVSLPMGTLHSTSFLFFSFFSFYLAIIITTFITSILLLLSSIIYYILVCKLGWVRTWASLWWWCPWMFATTAAASRDQAAFRRQRRRCIVLFCCSSRRPRVEVHQTSGQIKHFFGSEWHDDFLFVARKLWAKIPLLLLL